ncbi:MAG TPA: hypothetical protein VJH23_05080 [archaeon]|nr:hypothetical protein [archaeon]
MHENGIKFEERALEGMPVHSPREHHPQREMERERGMHAPVHQMEAPGVETSEQLEHLQRQAFENYPRQEQSHGFFAKLGRALKPRRRHP